jgi:hypothetical protein
VLLDTFYEIGRNGSACKKVILVTPLTGQTVAAFTVSIIDTTSRQEFAARIGYLIIWKRIRVVGSFALGVPPVLVMAASPCHLLVDLVQEVHSDV